MLNFRADLHCHTNCSDGSLTPQELIEEAKKKGLSGISITDHDTLDAYTSLTPNGLLVGVGAEFSCFYKNDPVHVLGYDMDVENSALQNLCLKHKERRQKRNLRILEKLALLGMPIYEEEVMKVASGKIIGRPHIANVMLQKGYVLSFQEAFNRFLGEGKAAYVAGEMMGVADTVAIIKAAGGKAFLAHPHLLISKKRAIEILSMGFDGLEGYYARFPLEQNEPWLKVAKDKNLKISGGSDFHGDLKPMNILGSSWVDEEIFKSIFTHSLTS